ncbi:hypothetical protein AB0451_03185 [Streptomyces sp. NPDC052000]|uniref:hypothetical protein n=1 Tax=Streptomyces sp. NPDC052000 TaxID=3155676 RepID=UPI00344DC515
MAIFNPPELRRLADFMEALPHCPHGCANGAVYASPTFRIPTPDDTIDDQVSEIIARYAPEAAGRLRQHLAEDHQCGHVVAYLTGYNCERCGATPEQISPHPDRIRADIDRARFSFERGPDE